MGLGRQHQALLQNRARAPLGGPRRAAMAKNTAISPTLGAAFVTAATLAFSPLAAEQKGGPGDGAKDELAQNFQAEHEIGRRFHFDPNDLPAPKSGPIATDRSLVVPYDGQVP